MCKCLLVLLAIVCPPLAILFHEGCTCGLLINILLSLLGWIPGVIHALYILLCREDRQTTNVYIATNSGPAPPAYDAHA